MKSVFGRVLAMLAGAAGLAQAGAGDTPTFTKDVAPILFKHCASCHRPGEIAPFSLLEYKDAAKRADFLAKITGENRMPPWSPEPGFGHFKDERRLTVSEKATIAAWAKAGAPEGDPGNLPAKPAFGSGWVLGKPDLVVEMPAEFTIPASGPDVYQCFTQRGSKMGMVRLGVKQGSSRASVRCSASGHEGVSAGGSFQCMNRKESVAMTVLKS
jgi:mono/diheme cytochrome c family protein